MSEQYVMEINSMFRNRNVNPYPGQIVFEVSSSSHVNNDGNSLNARDPVFNGYPRYQFKGNSAEVTAMTFGTGGTRTNPILNNSNSDISQYYNGYNITDVTLGETRQIVNYDSSTQTITMNKPFGDAWAETDQYTITDPSTNSMCHLQPIDLVGGEGAAIFPDNYYINDVLYDETINEYAIITYYSAGLRLATLDRSFSAAWNVNDTYSMRYDIPTVVGTTISVSPFEVILDTAASNVTDTYVGYGLYLQNPDEFSIITTYDGPTRTATVKSQFTNLTNREYNVLRYTRDNYRPVLYAKSEFSHQQAVCYDIEITSISIPNQLLYAFNGGRIVSYGNVYVALQSQMNSSNRNILATNNPALNKVEWICPTTDVTDSIDISKFLRIDSAGVKQRMKFRPTDTFELTVYLENGEIFRTEKDTFSPLSPNPDVQIKCVFLITRAT